jgi:hypothetical protein
MGSGMAVGIVSAKALMALSNENVL